MSIVGLAIPTFWLATLVIVIPAVTVSWSPRFGYIEFVDDPIANLKQFAIPGAVGAMGFAAILLRLTRVQMLEVMRQDYVRTARAKGLKEFTVILRHALKNADDPGPDRGRALARRVGLRLGVPRADLLAAGAGPLRGPVSHRFRLHGNPGIRATHRHRLRAREPDHRSPLRRPRSKDSLLVTAIAAPELLVQRSFAGKQARSFARFARTQPLGTFGLTLVLIIVFIALFGEWLVRSDPDAFSNDILQGPNAKHWFGTDHIGRGLLLKSH